jgi:hypothetical protein
VDRHGTRLATVHEKQIGRLYGVFDGRRDPPEATPDMQRGQARRDDFKIYREGDIRKEFAKGKSHLSVVSCRMGGSELAWGFYIHPPVNTVGVHWWLPVTRGASAPVLSPTGSFAWVGLVIGTAECIPGPIADGAVLYVYRAKHLYSFGSLEWLQNKRDGSLGTLERWPPTGPTDE